LNDLTAESAESAEEDKREKPLDLLADYEYDNQYQRLKYSQDTTKLLSEV
jgi:hypothetical protein